MILAFVKAYWKQPAGAAVAVVVVACIIVAWNVHGDQQYEAGRDTANQAWKLKWAERDKSDALAQALWNDVEREKERRRQRPQMRNKPMVRKLWQKLRLMPMMLSVLLPACSSSSPSPAQLRQV
jgi:hypothetical protein